MCLRWFKAKNEKHKFHKKKSKFSNMNLNIFKTNRLMHTYTQQAFKSHLSNICLTLLLCLVVVPRCNSSLRFARCIPSRTNFSVLVALGFPVVVPRNGFPRPRRAGPSSKFCAPLCIQVVELHLSLLFQRSGRFSAASPAVVSQSKGYIVVRSVFDHLMFIPFSFKSFNFHLTAFHVHLLALL